LILCTLAGVLYAFFQHDIPTGISLAGYLLTVCSLILAIVSAGDFIGLAKPDAFSFAYDIEDKEMVDEEYVQGILDGGY
jgi:hypothetical protein